MFNAVKALNTRAFENPKVEDSNGKLITNPNEILTTVANHFKCKFKDETSPTISPFQGTPRPLNQPISAAEIRTSFNSLRNNKAPGDDQLNPELLKHGTSLLDEVIANTINNAFSNHQELDINIGVLIAIQKPGKPMGPPNNLRP